MKSSLLLLGSTVLLSAVGSASIVCPGTMATPSTYDVYLSTVNNAGGCTIGPKLFSNFAFSNVNSGGAVPVPATSVGVQPVSVPEEGFVFTLPLSAGINQAADVTLSYNASAPRGLFFSDATLTQTGGFTGTGNATIKDTLCLNGLILGGCVGGTSLTLQTFNNSLGSQPIQHVVFATPVSSVDVSKDILAASNGQGTATISVASNTLSQPNVPEPVSLLLMGSGLLAVGVIGRRKRSGGRY